MTFNDRIGYKKHTKCISEDEKYQKAFFKGKKSKINDKVVNLSQKTSKKNPDPKKSKPPSNLTPGQCLYKVVKSIKSKDEKKAFLKRFQVADDGSIVFK